VRAVTGLPLGAPGPITPTVMVNFIGGLPASEEILAVPGTHLHLYNKEPRPGRKVGHVNVVELGSGAESLEDRAKRVLELAKSSGR
jgi:5-(carboxyamino)imidazole ribonucleotide synthase